MRNGNKNFFHFSARLFKFSLVRLVYGAKRFNSLVNIFAGTVHPMVTVTPSPMGGAPSILQPSCRRSADSSPSHSHSHSHSQMSRNSSRKSNNSVNCKIDGEYMNINFKRPPAAYNSQRFRFFTPTIFATQRCHRSL